MMSSLRIQNLRQQLLEAEEAAARELEPKSNHGTSNSFNNHGGGGQNFSNAKINSGANSGDQDSYGQDYFSDAKINRGANYGDRYGYGQDYFSNNAKINSGTNSADRNRYRTANNYGGRALNNGGTFNGHGNGGFIDGDFHAPTTNYNY
ncbi:abscisic acid and environmental stress-inducible protein-like [Lotus japonicus]|uniref:Uncharacterized protein n=1 Tax=Lotus japonicus TaxID=34305 RepID=I3SMW3_LOTJA|nr:abscisic acid and environmental stress-inducible protein-like [Lotus japonicus]AFK41605.1 unknown [Lotus japonicus]